MKKKKHDSGEKEIVLKYVDSTDKNHKKERLDQKVLSLLTHIDKCIDTKALNKTEKLLERAMLVLQTDYTYMYITIFLFNQN